MICHVASVWNTPCNKKTPSQGRDNLAVPPRLSSPKQTNQPLSSCNAASKRLSLLTITIKALRFWKQELPGDLRHSRPAGSHHTRLAVKARCRAYSPVLCFLYLRFICNPSGFRIQKSDYPRISKRSISKHHYI